MGPISTIQRIKLIMAGAEIIGKEELNEILDLFSGDSVTLYRYGPNNYKTKELAVIITRQKC